MQIFEIRWGILRSWVKIGSGALMMQADRAMTLLQRDEVQIWRFDGIWMNLDTFSRFFKSALIL